MSATQNRVIGRGKLYFDQFVPGTNAGVGELYLGNTPALNLTKAQTKLDHFSSESGLKVKDDSVILQDETTGKFDCDNIVPANLALWYGGTATNNTQASATAATETIHVIRGRYYQIGTSAANPSGLRNLANFSAKILTVTYAPTNYDIDLETGRLYIHPDAAIIGEDPTAATALILTYDVTAGTRDLTIVDGTIIRGALRFISDNPVGDNHDYYMPMVQLSANGDYALKADTWQMMSFSLDVLKRDDSTEFVYIDGRPGAF